MSDRVWQPLAELELRISPSDNSVVYCLCSRSFIRSKIGGEVWAELFNDRVDNSEEKSESGELVTEEGVDIKDTKVLDIKKPEVEQVAEAVSCYCSASHYSTDDYDSVMQSHKETIPLQNSDSGADLSEHCCRIAEEGELEDEVASQQPTAWDKYWSDNGEDIIWKSWIEKYGAYINPNFIEQSICDAKPKELSEAVPDLKISRYSSCSNHSEAEEAAGKDCKVADIKPEKILKSNSVGSCDRYALRECKEMEMESRVRSRCSNCSNTNLSVKSMGNTTVTTDSMTNVTKITLSSLDLSCECSVLSSSSEDCLTSPSSSSSSKEDMCTEADQWWKKVWKEHYQQQYSIYYQAFSDGTLPNSSKEAAGAYLGNLLERLQQDCSLDTADNSEQLEYQEEMEEDAASDTLKLQDGRPTCSTSKKNKRSLETDNGPWRSKKLIKSCDSLRHCMGLMGLAFNPQPNTSFDSGYLTYRKRNIRAQNRRLNLCESKPRTHLRFDDDGNAYSLTRTDRPEGSEQKTNVTALLEALEPESLGYEAHSSSFEDDEALGKKEQPDQPEWNQAKEKKQRKKKKKAKKSEKEEGIREVLPPEVLENPSILKYWRRRYQLFLRYDEGIHLDRESWFSVTPEKVALHHAERCRCDVIVDAFCGAGGNSIQFAFTCERVIAIDIDPKKIELARQNAKVYGVEDRIEFMVGNFMEVAPRLQADVVFLSPPWGGPEYTHEDSFGLDSILPGVGGTRLFELASSVSHNVAYFLPRNINVAELTKLAEVEIEQNFLDRKLISVTAYFGELIMDTDNPQLQDV